MDNESGLREPLSTHNYQRKTISFAQASGGAAFNSTSVSWSATGKWGTIKYVFIADQNHILIYEGGFNLVVQNGVIVSINENAVKVSIQGSKMSTYLKNKILDHVLSKGQRTFTPPSSIYVSLWKNDGNEVSGNNYSRVATSSDTWSQARGGRVLNSSVIMFPTPSADWGFISKVCLHDAQTGGNLLFTIPLENQFAVAKDRAPQFRSSYLKITLE
ncbi:MAG: hypothetical protein QXS68_06470 [Candidatus Methanomethylicaceae archaeon]